MKSGLMTSSAAFQERFASGLKALLHDYSELGVFLLVLANALQHDLLWDQLSSDLDKRLQQMKRALADDRHVPDDALDDLRVFQQLHQGSIESLRHSREILVGPWLVNFNPFRLLRPRRAAGRELMGISLPFDSGAFHFGRPYLRKELLWQGDLNGERATLFYNKFPFMDYHCLLVPQVRAGIPQLLERRYHQWVWQLCLDSLENMQGLGIGYNSLGAGASVNHLHFQMFQKTELFPVEHQRWVHNGGVEAYPLSCRRYSSAEQAWQEIQQLHLKRQPYNLLYRPGCCYLMSRRPQSESLIPSWSVGMGWSELAGFFLLQHAVELETLQAQDLTQALANLEAPA